MTINDFEKWSKIQIENNQKDFIEQVYIPVVVEHIAEHGCSGLKCKKCPLNNMCDRDVSKSKKIALQVLAMIKLKGVDNK